MTYTFQGGPKPADHQSVFAVALSRRPIMPGTIMPIRVKDERLVRSLSEEIVDLNEFVTACLKHIGKPGFSQTLRGDYRLVC